MANEFKIKHGFISTGAGTIEGVLRVSGAAYADNGSRVASRPWVTQFLSDNSYATATDISTAISNLVDSAPGTLDTLNELAAAIGDDADFAGTITTSISTKLPLAGGTMTGNITFTDDAEGIVWSRNTDGASIKFYNTADGDEDSRLEFHTNDNNNEYFRWTHGPSGGAVYEVMKLMPTSSGSSTLTVAGDIYAASNKVATETHVSANYLSKFHDITLTLTGDVSGSGTFNNMSDLSFDVQVADDSHNHDGRYYTETEMDTFLGDKLSTSGGTLTGDLIIGSSSDTSRGLHITASNTAGAPSTTAYISMTGYEGRAIGTFYNDISNAGQWFAGIPYSGGFNNFRIGFDSAGSQPHYGTNALFNVDKNGNVAITGTISASGYNNSNWDTAYDTTQSLGSAAFESANTFAAASHTHAAGDITSGTFPSERLSGTYTIDVAGTSTRSNYLYREDNRTISPREIPNGHLKFGFTSFNNDNTGPWADFLHLRSYTDSSGGRDNLLMFSKSDMEIRLWQQDFDSTDNYADFRDVAFKDELPNPAITSNGTTPSLSSGISAAEVRTLIGAGTSSSDTNYYLNGASFNTSNGVLTLNVAGATDQTVDLDGRYSESGHNHDGRYMILAGDGGTYADIVDNIDGTSVFSFANHIEAPYANVNIVTTYASHYSGRRAQFWHGDTPEGGVWWRGRQGDAVGYHPWQKLWTSHDFDPDTFLTTTGKAADSNLLDGINSTSFLRSDVGDTATGTMTFSNVVNLNGAVNFNGVNGQNFTVNTDGDRIIWDFQRNGTRRMSFYHEADQETFNFSFESGSNLQINGNRILTTVDSSSFDAAGAADEVNLRIDNEVLPSIPTNNNQLTNGAGYITDGNTNWNNSYGFITESESDARFVNVTGDNVTGDLSVSGASLSVTSTADGSEAFFVDGVNGRLFTITDSLSDSLFSVNTISGLPVIEAFSDNTVKLGPFSNPVTIDAAGVLAIGGVTAATQTYVDTAVNNIIGGAPGALDTLNELAAAINDDASFASSVTTSLSLKAPLASPALTGTPTAPTQATSNNSTRIATTAFVKAQGYVTTDTNYYLNGITRSGNVLTFSVNGATNQTYTFGSAAWAATTAFDAAGTAASEAGAVNLRIDEEVLPAVAAITLSSLGYTGATNANYITNNNELTNGAGYITSADGGNAQTLDGIDSTSFLRSDANDSFSGTLTMSTQKALVASNYGNGVYGVYDASRYQHVWSMGVGYNLPENGASNGNGGSLYGLAWSYNPDYGYSGANAQSKPGLNHQLLLMMNGVTHTALGSGIWTNGLITTVNHGTSANWNTAYGWGNHASAGYLTALPSHNHDDRYYTETEADSRFHRTDGPLVLDARGPDIGGSASYVTSGSGDASLEAILNNVVLNLNTNGDEPATIYFKSGVNEPSDFAYISFLPNKAGTSEEAVLQLGVENDGAGSSDYIRLQGRVSTVVDYVTSEATVIQDWVYQGTQKAYIDVSGNLQLDGTITANGYNKSNWDTAFGWGNHASAGYAQGSFLPLAGGTVTGTIAANGGINMNNTNITNVNHITINDPGYAEGIQWGNMMISESPDDLSNQAGNLHIANAGDSSIRVTIDPEGNLYPSRDRLHLLGKDTNRWQIVFCEILDSAGQHEKNLQNPEGEKSVGDYATGTVLVWKGGKNIPCTEYADHMRMGIAVKDVASPLIQGAEPVLVTGKVTEGDYLITSRKEGHAEAISPELMRQQGLYDCVLGKALENGQGESHLVKTWINI